MEPIEHSRHSPESFLKIADFDTDVEICLDDPSKALSYQTGETSVRTGSTYLFVNRQFLHEFNC